MRPLWLTMFGVIVICAAAVVVGTGEPELVPVTRQSGAATIVGELTVGQDVFAPDTVTARASISADRELKLTALVVRVRDEAGEHHDFPYRADIALGATPTELTFRRELSEPGVYTYCLAYRVDGGEWVDLPPWQSVTIR